MKRSGLSETDLQLYYNHNNDNCLFRADMYAAPHLRVQLVQCEDGTLRHVALEDWLLSRSWGAHIVLVCSQTLAPWQD